MSDAAEDVSEAFREQCRVFLATHAQVRTSDQTRWGRGPDQLGGSPVFEGEEEVRWLAAARDWRRVEFDNGFGWLTGPAEYEGAGLSVLHERTYRELRDDYDVPAPDPFVISLGMVAPTIYRHGGSGVQSAYLRGLYRGDLLGCQLFSEPSAGSDLASVRTRAVQDGSEWIVDGQKVWTSLAHHADIGLLLCRTDPTMPKHRGLTVFVVDMRSPGVQARPLRQMTGAHEFNEVFLTGVRIPDSNRLGPVNGGWSVAISTLMGERALGVGRDVFGLQEATRRLLDHVRHEDLGSDPIIRDATAARYIDARVIELNGLRSQERLLKGHTPGPEESVTKISNVDAMRRLSETVGMLTGSAMVADTGDWGLAAWAGWTMHTAGCRIAAGTDEVMRDIIGERVLGLPKGSGA